MNKVVDFLEKYVQWVALGLGGLYVLYMAWSFILQTPVSTDIGTKTLGAGEVDRYIVENPVAELDSKMQISGVPEIVDPAPLKDFKNELQLAGFQPQTLNGLCFAALPQTMRGQVPTPDQTQNPRNPVVKVAALPIIPPAVMGDVVVGSSNVVPPGAMAAAGGASPAQPVAGGVDKVWTTVGWQINNKDLAAAFQAVKASQFMSRTAALDVQLIRQEQLPDGSWGNETVIPRLSFNVVEQMPAANAGPAVEKPFLNWADASQPLILQPPFFDVLQGDKWHMPGTGGAVVEVPVINNNGGEAFDPNREYTPAELKNLTPAQLREWQIAQQKKKDEEAKRKAAARPPRQPSGGGAKAGRGGGGGGGGGGGPVRPGPNDPGRPGARPPAGPGGTAGPNMGGGTIIIPPGYRPGGDQNPGGMQPEQPPVVPTPVAPTATSAACPAGEFDPGSSPDWICWAHDDTVKPGHVFRYKIVYTLKNPLYTYNKFVANPQLATVLGISSDAGKTEWTKEIKVPALTSFYMAQNFRDGAPTVKFDVFAMQGGQKHSKTFEVAPGDSIGLEDAGTNYTTGWTLVDMGKDRNQTSYVVLADPAGALVRHDFNTDQANPDYASDKKSVTGAPAAAASASVTPRGPTPPAGPAGNPGGGEGSMER